MASISSPGLGSGLDVNSIISQLMAVEQRPLTALASKEATFQAKISALGSVRGALSGVETAAGTLKSGGFTGLKATVRDTAVASASASSIAPAGKYSLEVTQLAQAQVVATRQNPTVAAGTLGIQYGANALVNVTVEADDTLGDIAATINADATLKTQVRASVVDGRLLLESLSTGAAGTTAIRSASAGLEGFLTVTATQQSPAIVAGNLQITYNGGSPVSIAVGASDTLADIAAAINADGTLGSQIKASVIDNRLLLEDLNPNAPRPVAITGADAGLEQFLTSATAATVPRAGQNALFRVNGLSVERSSNSVGDVITGVTLNLLKTNSGSPTEVSVGRDAAGLKSALDAFIKAYNDANKTMADLGRYDQASKQGSILTGDSTLRTAQTQLRSLLSSPFAGLSDPFANQLSQLGISAARDGSLSLDSSRLNALFAERPESVEALVKAFGTSAQTLAKGLSGEDGLVASRVEGINASVESINRQREVLNRRLEQIESRYRKQFTSLDTLVSSLQKTSSFLTQQLANLPKSGS